MFGTGRVLSLIAPTMRQLECIECYAIASRTLKSAEEAIKKYGFLKAYGSYEELAADPQVELIYIATPHAFHYDNMKLCIQHKKPVLCEKAFTMNSTQAREIWEMAKREGVFVAEAIWTRYMPCRQIIQEVLESGIVGKINMMTATLALNVHSNSPRLLNLELCGGALLDVGVYGVNFALMHFGADIERVDSTVQFTDTGVDATESITLKYKDGRMAVLTHSIFSRSSRKAVFYGEKGYIEVDNINNPSSVSVFDLHDNLIQKINMPPKISGYEYELMECVERIQKNETESLSIPLKDTITVMNLLDTIRRQWGLVYPQERAQ